jgi:hypothetical protein
VRVEFHSGLCMTNPNHLMLIFYIVTEMVRVLIYHGGHPEYLRMGYVEGEIYDNGEIDEDVLSITVWESKLHELGYRNRGDYWYKLDDEWSVNGLSHIRNDSDIITLIDRILTENRSVLHLYVDHETDVPDIIDPTEQPADVEILRVGDEGDVGDAYVEKRVGEDEGVGDEGDAYVGRGVGEDTYDESDDPDYEVDESDENLSGYETTDAEDEDLYTSVRRGKSKENTHEKFDWFGVGAFSNAHDKDAISSDSADSEREMESLSSDSDDVNASQTRGRRKKKIRYRDFTEHDLKGKIVLEKGL